MNTAQLALWYDIGKRIHETPIATIDYVDDPTFSDVMTAEEIARMDADDITQAKTALNETGESVTLQQLAAELGIA